MRTRFGGGWINDQGRLNDRRPKQRWVHSNPDVLKCSKSYISVAEMQT